MAKWAGWMRLGRTLGMLLQGYFSNIRSFNDRSMDAGKAGQWGEGGCRTFVPLDDVTTSNVLTCN